MPAAQREKLFNTYLQAVQQLEVAAKEKASRARAAFQVCAFHLPLPCVHVSLSNCLTV